MKVIDLLNKIANGEEVPKKIKVSSFETGILCKEKDYIDYEVFWKDCDGDEHSYWLFDKPTYNDKLNQTIEILNDEAVIKEEGKKIEKLENEKCFYDYATYDSFKDKIDKTLYIIKAINLLETKTDILNEKIKEIIDKLNEVSK